MNFLYCNPRVCFLIFIHVPWHASYQPVWSVARFCILPCCFRFGDVAIRAAANSLHLSPCASRTPFQSFLWYGWWCLIPGKGMQGSEEIQGQQHPAPPEARLNLDQQEMTLVAGGGRRWFLVSKSISDLFPLAALPQGLPAWASLISPAGWRQAWSSQDIAALGGLQGLFSRISGNLHKVLCEFQKSVSKPNNWGSLILALQFSL